MAILYEEIRPKSNLTAALEKAQEETGRKVAVRGDGPKLAVPGDITPVKLSQEEQPLTLNTARLLDMTRWIFGNWARWPSPAALDVATLWTASTWFADENGRLVLPASPRLFFIADKGSGKTRAMKLIRVLSRNPTGIVKAPVTAPGVREALNAGRTVFLDEVDRQFGAGRGHTDLQALVSAYEPEAGSLNARGGLNEQATFGPMALGAKPRILTGTGGYLEDLFERSFVITPIKSTDAIPDLDEEFEHVTEHLPKVLEFWGESVRPAQGKLWPVHDVPPKLTARMREISLPLLTVADRAVDPAILAAGGHDLRWAKAGREAVQSLLLGHGSNGPQIMEDVAARLRALGMEV